jgi:hypothetical protein
VRGGVEQSGRLGLWAIARLQSLGRAEAENLSGFQLSGFQLELKTCPSTRSQHKRAGTRR